MKDRSADMSLATAKRVVDQIFTSPSPALAIEFQGGEPLVNFEVVRFVIEYATERNRDEGRDLQFLLVSNLAAMDEEVLNSTLHGRRGTWSVRTAIRRLWHGFDTVRWKLEGRKQQAAGRAQ